ncbi:ABC transporter substrate-binding protein [Reyranella sp.]|uniref:ABC transporter substrate-binding protein n=1 Tax=Reyranella sp. TaxID=1929291 RepID=UPI003BADB1C8
MLFPLLLALSAPIATAQQPLTVVSAVSADPGHLNPAITTGSPTHAVADSLFNGLLALDEKGDPRPDLAVRWSLSEDGQRARFELSKDAKWHDGRPVTADDVKFTFEEVLVRHHARTRASLGPVLEGIDVIDPATVEFRLKRPYPALLQQLDVTEAPILPRHVYGTGEIERNAANLRPVGSGPFRFESYAKDDRVVLARNTAYFKPGLPHIDRLVFRVIPDTATQAQALAAGEVDFVGRVAPSEIARLQRSGKATLTDVKFGPGGGNCIMTLGFNLDRPALQVREVREAFAAAIDRRPFVERILLDHGRVADAPISSGIAWAHAAGLFPASLYDPGRAKALLDGAGLRPDAEGVRLTVELVQFATFGRYADLLRDQLGAVGIRVRPRLLDPAAMVDAVFKQRNFDLTLVSYCNGADPEIGVRRMYVSSNIGNIPFSNAAAYRDKEVDALFAAAGGTADRERRAEAYRAIQRIVVRDLPYLWLVETDFTAAWASGLAGFAPWSGQFAERAKRP